MKEDDKKFLRIISRYLILVLIALPGLDFFYYVFLPLTKLPVFTLLGIFFDPIMVGNVIFISQKSIEIVGACVAGSAYYLLLILNLSVPKINFLNRIKMLLFGFSIFLFINIARIFILSVMYVNDSLFFDFAHKLFWYIGSTIFIVAIWFLQIKVFKVKEIPFYSDLKYLYRKSRAKN